jgi:hypothetical protein
VISTGRSSRAVVSRGDPVDPGADFSFVEVDAEQAERAVEYLDGTKLKGKQIRMRSR